MVSRRGVYYFRERFLPAPFWKRVLAYIIDSLVISFIVSPFQRVLKDVSETSSLVEFYTQIISTGMMVKLLYVIFIVAVITLLYWSVLEHNFTQSLGKMILRIHVRSTSKKGVTFWQCLLRNISKVSTFLLVADCIYMFATKQHQRYMEKLSNTEVVEVLEL